MAVLVAFGRERRIILQEDRFEVGQPFLDVGRPEISPLRPAPDDVPDPVELKGRLILARPADLPPEAPFPRKLDALADAEAELLIAVGVPEGQPHGLEAQLRVGDRLELKASAAGGLDLRPSQENLGIPGQGGFHGIFERQAALLGGKSGNDDDRRHGGVNQP